MFDRVVAIVILVSLAGCAPRTRGAQHSQVFAGTLMMITGGAVAYASRPLPQSERPERDPNVWFQDTGEGCGGCVVAGLGLLAVGAIIAGSSLAADIPGEEPVESYEPVEVAPVTCTLSGGCVEGAR